MIVLSDKKYDLPKRNKQIHERKHHEKKYTNEINVLYTHVISINIGDKSMSHVIEGMNM